MLVELRIENLLLIAKAEIEFISGLNALTGETGAGKSLLVDALEFLLGARGDTDMVRTGAPQAEVSARFLLADRELVGYFAQELGIVFDDDAPSPKSKTPAELVLSRTLPRAGRARAYANGRPIALPALKWLGEHMLDIHGQHENQSLLRQGTRLEILDRFAGANAERDAVRHCHAEALSSARALAALRQAARDRHGRQDLMRFQLRELDEARLDEFEPQSLEGEVKLLRGAEKIRAAALAANGALDGDDDQSAAALLTRALKSFSSIGEAGPEAAALRKRLDGLLAEIQDAAREASDLAEKARSDPERLADLEERRERLRALERKHGRDLAGLKALQQSLAGELANLDQIDAHTEARESDLAKRIQDLRSACEKLSRRRRAAARDLEKRVNKELADLGLKGAALQVALHANPADGNPVALSAAMPTSEILQDDEAARLLPPELKSTGAESAEILFSANPDLAPKPLKDCASGGEISRVMLALKGVLAKVSGADRLPVVVFDEVDSGVGGRLGAVLGRKLRQLAEVRQVICVTHQPQIAAYAQRQVRVDKKREGARTAVMVETMEGDRRIEELAKMLRGDAASAHTRKEAEEMLRAAEKE